MKNLMIVVLISICMIGCKDNDKKEDNMKQTAVDETSRDMNKESNNSLELGCYEYKTDRIDVKMEITKIDEGSVNGNLYYAYAEKDKNTGTFSGNINGDKLIGTYTFMSEGKESVRDVAFKIEKEQIVEGFGDLDEGGTKFKDTTNLTYSTTTPWKKAACN